MLNPYKSAPIAKVGKSVFDLSYTKKFTCDMGELIPCALKAMVPGDVFRIGHSVTLRFNPMIAPLIHEVYMYIEDFFVPYRLLWDDWEDFITGGADGTEAPTMPVWSSSGYTVGTLWDYMEFPTGITTGVSGQPMQMPLRAYNMIYNEYYRDENQDAEVSTIDSALKIRRWEKDYFTSALESEQKGTAPAFPLVGTVTVEGIGGGPTFDATGITGSALRQSTGVNPPTYLQGTSTGNSSLVWNDPQLQVDLSTATAGDVNDMRLAFQMQKLLERANIGGSDYEEFLRAMYGVRNGDERMQRPEWIGGMKNPVIFSEVLQTSEDGTTPQGTLRGHGISVGRKMTGTYRATEFGIYMAILSVMPKAAYSQGVDKDWLRPTRWDFFNPLLVGIGEQPITTAEIYTTSSQATNETVFGYQGRYNEMRTSNDKICGDLRSTYDYWHLGRQFSSQPSLNATFLEYDGRKDIFAAPSVDGLIVNCGNIIKAVRPLPILPQPGGIDHG